MRTVPRLCTGVRTHAFHLEGGETFQHTLWGDAFY